MKKKLFDDEKYTLDGVFRDSHDLLNCLYEYEMRILPDANNPLFLTKNILILENEDRLINYLEMIRKKVICLNYFHMNKEIVRLLVLSILISDVIMLKKLYKPLVIIR